MHQIKYQGGRGTVWAVTHSAGVEVNGKVPTLDNVAMKHVQRRWQ